MSATIKYDGNEIGTLEGSQTATLNCEGQVMRTNLVIEHNGVESVNGKTGEVSLTASDVGALPNTVTIPTAMSQLTNDGGYAKTTSHYTKTESDNKYQPKGTYLELDDYEDDRASITDDINGKLDKTTYNSDKATFATKTELYSVNAKFNDYLLADDLYEGAETWTFTLANGSTVTKKVVLA